jgi:hypothetical protein
MMAAFIRNFNDRRMRFCREAGYAASAAGAQARSLHKKKKACSACLRLVGQMKNLSSIAKFYGEAGRQET